MKSTISRYDDDLNDHGDEMLRAFMERISLLKITLCVMAATMGILFGTAIAIMWQDREEIDKARASEAEARRLYEESTSTGQLAEIYFAIGTEKLNPPDDFADSHREFFIEVGRELTRPTKDTILTTDEVIDLCTRVGAYHPRMIAAQGMHESGLGRSRIGKAGNNLYGMTTPGRRTHLQNGKCKDEKGKDTAFGFYASKKLSVLDRIWYDFVMFGYAGYVEKDTYTDKVCSVYAEDPEYQTRWLAMERCL